MPFPSAQKAGRAEAEPDLGFQSPPLINAVRQKCTDIYCHNIQRPLSHQVSLCYVLYNHAENFRPFPQNSMQVSNFLQCKCIREGWTRWRESFWLPAFCLPNNLKKRLPGRVSKRKVVYKSHLKYKWLNSYPRGGGITWRIAKVSFSEMLKIHTSCYFIWNYRYSLLLEK